MEPKIVATLLKKEINDSLGNRWFMLYAAAFTGLALLLSWLSLSSGGTGYSGFASFGRTAASLVNLVLLVVPLMALTTGAASLIAQSVKEVVTVHKLEFGVPEAMWVIRVEDFPVVVTMDSHGQSIHDQIEAQSQAKLAELIGV